MRSLIKASIARNKTKMKGVARSICILKYFGRKKFSQLFKTASVLLFFFAFDHILLDVRFNIVVPHTD